MAKAIEKALDPIEQAKAAAKERVEREERAAREAEEKAIAAKQPPAPPPPELPPSGGPPKRFRVLADRHNISMPGGSMVSLYEGQEFSIGDFGADGIERLKRSGVKLAEI